MPLLFNFNQNASFLFILLLFTLFAGLVVYAARNEYRMRRILKGGQLSDLEKSLIKTEADLTALMAFKEHADKNIARIERELDAGARNIGVVRFNPFGKKDGGNQSFAAAFVNKKGDGVVFSSLSARDRVNFFAKPLARNASEYELSPEEKQAIKKAHEIRI